MFGITPMEVSAETAEDETRTEAVNDPECSGSEDGLCESKF